MTEERKEKPSEDYQFINEKIVPKRKKKWLRRLETTVFILCMAVVFGVVSQAAFLLSKDYLTHLLGIEEARQTVDLPKPTEPALITFSPTPKPTPKPTAKPTPVPTAKATPTPDAVTGPSDSVTPSISTEPKVTPEAFITPDAEVTPEADITPEAEISPEPDSTQSSIEAYLTMYESIRKVAEDVSGAFVTVEAIEQGVDWFQEVYEKRSKTTGLILGNDGVDLLILVGTEQYTGANSIEVFFGDTVIPGRIYSMDRGYGLAVIAVALEQISEEILSGVQMGILATEEDLVVGTPVIALGAPNGYEGSMEFGMVTSLGSTVSVTDGEVAYFTANITDYPQGYGYVVNLEGKILGLITHSHKANQEDGIFSAISLDSIRGIMIKLLNNSERAYFGIRGQNLPKNLAKELGLESGVYVSAVENSSPALAAGIKAGDILVSVAGKNVEGIRGFSDLILECSIREIVQVKLLRKAEDGLREMTVEVSLTDER